MIGEMCTSPIIHIGDMRKNVTLLSSILMIGEKYTFLIIHIGDQRKMVRGGILIAFSLDPFGGEELCLKICLLSVQSSEEHFKPT